MQIKYNSEKLNTFNDIIVNQDLSKYKGMTRTYGAFESSNLSPEIKMSVLRKLSTTNHLNITDFESFWMWVKAKHGTALSHQLAHFISPGDATMESYIVNKMRGDRSCDFWNHLKSRFYKKWCSIVTEMQCVYSLAEYAEISNNGWKVLASPELDAVGIDFALVVEQDGISKVFPFQIKKESYNVYAQKKDNAKDNFSRVETKKKSILVLTKELDKLNIAAEIQDSTILKYGLPKNKQMPYAYLGEHDNGFVYYKGDILTKEIIENVIL